MVLIIDVETNSLRNPTQIWVIVCKDVDTGELHVFREVTSNEEEKRRFLQLVGTATLIGHHILGYDVPVLESLLGYRRRGVSNYVDTFIISKLVDYSRPGGHSIEQYGKEFGLEKGKNHYLDFFQKWSQPLEDYCVRDVEICHRIYMAFHRIITDNSWSKAIDLEHRFQLVVNNLHRNGFSFNTSNAQKLLSRVEKELSELDKEILNAFPPRLVHVREITPKYTRYGTLHKGDFRWVESGDLSEYNGGPFCRCSWNEFNPSSHKQIIRVLADAGWTPTDRTQTHIDTEREINRLKYSRNPGKELDLKNLHDKLVQLRVSGWKINENNLSTLPSKTPSPARTLAKRILLESRRRTLTEWLGLVHPDTGRIHGDFQSIGAWTHRMAHQRPNTANIPTEFKEDGTRKLLGKELRSLWQAPRKRLLVGVDAEGIQLRIFAHYIDDKEFTDALVQGKKGDRTDPHSLNQRILGSVCRSRQSAKRFIYALLLGAGISKLAQILECSESAAKEALDRLLERYQGFAALKKTTIPKDADRGYFIGLDGRKVPIPGDSRGERRHLCMSGYLQNGEAIIMKRATLKWEDKLADYQALLVNLVHDEWQTETPNNMESAICIAKMQADSLKEVGKELKLKCPLAGSYWNDDHKDYTIGTNWSVTH